MANTALGAKMEQVQLKGQVTRTITFKNQEHEDFYREHLRKCRYQGRISYLEQACTCSLKLLSFIMKQMRIYAKKSGLKPSFCYYKQWGAKKKNGQGHRTVIPLAFSKSRKPEIERAYATHFVDKQGVEQMKKAILEKSEDIERNRK